MPHLRDELSVRSAQEARRVHHCRLFRRRDQAEPDLSRGVQRATGHTEVVLVVYDPTVITDEELLGVFLEGHQRTEGLSQGNDVGTQYRSAIYRTHRLAGGDDLRGGGSLPGLVAARAARDDHAEIAPAGGVP